MTRPQSVEKGNSSVKVYQFALHPKPPLCKGRWHGGAVTEGLCGKNHRIRIRFGEIVTFHCVNPAAIFRIERKMTAPFTQGSLGRSRARGFLYSLNPTANAAGFQHVEKPFSERKPKKQVGAGHRPARNVTARNAAAGGSMTLPCFF